MRRSLLCSAIAFLALLSGCTSVQGPISSEEPSIDSLRAENARLRDQNRTLRDSLQLQDDVDSGQFYRDLRTLQDQLTRLTYEVRLLRNGGLTVTILPVDSVFASAGTTISDVGAQRLKAVSRQLQSTYPNRTIRVEGHADNTDLGEDLQERFGSNWGLSSARAAAVVNRLTALTTLDRSQFVAVGYGASRPRASNDTVAGRRRNRRVRITVLPLPQADSRPIRTSW